jgi:hypothetical protein
MRQESSDAGTSKVSFIDDDLESPRFDGARRLVWGDAAV